MLNWWKSIFYSLCILISNVLDQRSIKNKQKTECIEHIQVFGGENLTVSTCGVIWQNPDTSPSTTEVQTRLRAIHFRVKG